MIVRPQALLAAIVALCAFTAQARTYIKCDCSPSKRGFSRPTLAKLVEDLKKIVDKAEENTQKGMTRTRVEQEERTMAAVKFKACVDNYSHEECVNADAAIRRGKCYPNCRTFCEFYEPTWESINAGNQRAPRCDLVPRFASDNPDIVSGNAEEKSAIRPTPSPSRQPVEAPGAQENETNENEGAENGSNEEAAGESEGGEAGVVVAPESSAAPLKGEGAPGISPAPANEGCVAVEHLEGYVMQHRRHLERQVLCAHGFCATPNHAIIVNGEWTSMKLMCANKWDCARSVKLVNNLKLAKNSRAVFNDFITITPYDLRFPRWGVWLVQHLEDLYELVGVSGLVATTAAIVLTSLAVVSKRV